MTCNCFIWSEKIRRGLGLFIIDKILANLWQRHLEKPQWCCTTVTLILLPVVPCDGVIRLRAVDCNSGYASRVLCRFDI